MPEPVPLSLMHAMLSWLGREVSPVIAGLSVLATVAIAIVTSWRQEKWQRRQAMLQEKWQSEERKRLSTWREEDLVRQAAVGTFNIRVSISIEEYRATYYGKPDGYGGHLPTERVADLIAIKAKNWGSAEARLQAPYLLLPDDTSLSFFPMHLANAESTGGTFPALVRPGDAAKGTILATTAVQELRDRGYLGVVDIRGAFQDTLDRPYISEPFPFDLDHQFQDEY